MDGINIYIFSNKWKKKKKQNKKIINLVNKYKKKVK